MRTKVGRKFVHRQSVDVLWIQLDRSKDLQKYYRVVEEEEEEEKEETEDKEVESDGRTVSVLMGGKRR